VLTSRDVERATFTATVLRRGYDQREVDEFLARVSATLRRLEDVGGQAPPDPGDVRAADVEAVTFTQTQVRGGYDEREVDQFLDRVLATVRHYAADASIRAPGLAPIPGVETSPHSPITTEVGLVDRLRRVLHRDL